MEAGAMKGFAFLVACAGAVAVAERSAGIAADLIDASDRTHREINERIGDPADDRVTARIEAFLDGVPE